MNYLGGGGGAFKSNEKRGGGISRLQLMLCGCGGVTDTDLETRACFVAEVVDPAPALNSALGVHLSSGRNFFRGSGA